MVMDSKSIQAQSDVLVAFLCDKSLYDADLCQTWQQDSNKADFNASHPFFLKHELKIRSERCVAICCNPVRLNRVRTQSSSPLRQNGSRPVGIMEEKMWLSTVILKYTRLQDSF